MKKFQNSNSLVLLSISILWLLFSGIAEAQHRGDNLSFQGLFGTKDYVPRSSAMGNAVTAISGDISSLFYNPAGLARIKKIQATISANNYGIQWRENQNYRPDRYFVTLPFYLEGLYIPDPKNNGKWDYQIVQDSSRNYFVKEPLLGVDDYSEEAADWKKDKNAFGLTNVAAAIPFSISNKNIVAAISFNLNNNLYDYDRNDTYLDPHLGYFEYGGDITRVDGLHTMNMSWSRFTRERIGSLKNITAAVSTEIVKNIMIGAGINVMWGESDDLQSLVKVGDFLLSNQQRFKFSYVDKSDITVGTSKFSSANFNLGAIFELNRVSVGINFELPYTLSREYDYVRTITDSSSISTSLSGKDEFEVPAIFTVGISFNPIDEFKIGFDYRSAPYGTAKHKIASGDSTFRNWVDQNTLSFGLEYKASKLISIMAGYRTIPQTFIPDGSAITEKGPDATSYNAGVSLNFSFGRFDVSYELRVLKYYDQYFSNTNYAFNKLNNIQIGYTYTLN